MTFFEIIGAVATTLTGIILTVFKGYINRLIKELDEKDTKIQVLDTKLETYRNHVYEEMSSLKSRVKVVENQLSNDVANLSKQIEALQSSIRHLEGTITANSKAMYDLFMDLKNSTK